MISEIAIDRPFDAHVHFRQGEMLRRVAPLTAASFCGAMAMPNTDPPISSEDAALRYLGQIAEATNTGPPFVAWPTLYFGTGLTEATLLAAEPAILAVKFYPRGLTTNSRHGSDPTDPGVDRVLEILQRLGIPLSIHPEAPGYHEDRERLFAPIVRRWAEWFPRLKIVLEHLSDRRTLPLLELSNVYGTLTPQHLLWTGDDWVGPPLRPHRYCMPVIKRPEDRTALLWGVAEDFQDRLMLGTDSAPWVEYDKSHCGCAGVLNAPVALPVVADIFDRAGILDRLQGFCSDNARRIYGPKLDTLPGRVVTLARRPWRVPDRYGDVVPMLAGETLPWSQVDP